MPGTRRHAPDFLTVISRPNLNSFATLKNSFRHIKSVWPLLRNRFGGLTHGCEFKKLKRGMMGLAVGHTFPASRRHRVYSPVEPLHPYTILFGIYSSLNPTTSV